MGDRSVEVLTDDAKFEAELSRLEALAELGKCVMGAGKRLYHDGSHEQQSRNAKVLLRSFLIHILSFLIVFCFVALMLPQLVAGQTTRDSQLDEAEALNEQAIQLYNAGRYAEAEPLYERVIDIEIQEQKLGKDDPAVATRLYDLAVIYDSTGCYAGAEALYKRALEIQEKLGKDDPAVAKSLRGLALLYWETGRYAEAEPLYKRALEIWEKFGKDDSDLALSLNNLAMLYSDTGRDAEAEPLLKRVLEIDEKAYGKDGSHVALSLNNLAMLYDATGRYAEAEPLLKRALEIQEKLGKDDPAVAIGLVNLGGLYDDTGRYAEAEALYKRALEIQEKLGKNHPSVAIGLKHLADLYRETGRYAEAEPLLKRALEINKKFYVKDHPYLAYELNDLAELYGSLGRHQESHRLFLRGAAIGDKTKEMTFSLLSEKQKLAYMNQKMGDVEAFLSHTVLYLTGDSKAVTDTFNTWVLWKGSVLESQGRYIDALIYSDNPLIQEKFQELIAIRRNLARLQLSTPEQMTAEDYQKRLTELEKRNDALEAELSILSKEFSLAKQAGKVDAQKLSSLLPQDSAYLDFAKIRLYDFPTGKWGASHYLLFVLIPDEKGEVRLLDVGETEGIDQHISAYLKEIKKEQKSDKAILDREAQSLYDLIIKPVEPLVKKKHLFVSPDGNLNIIPFEVIVTPGGQYLLENYQISYLGAGRDAVKFAQAAFKGGTSLIMADPDYNLGLEGIEKEERKLGVTEKRVRGEVSADLRKLRFPPLHKTKKEADAIKGILETGFKQQVLNLQWEKALEEMLYASTSPRVLHLATHGYFLQALPEPKEETRGMRFTGRVDEIKALTTENPMLRSGIVLAGVNSALKEGRDDGVVSAEKVLGLRLRGTELVVLSACETGVGDVQTGEGVFGLKRAFILSGARSMVMSLWSVPDVETVDLMTEFYSLLSKGTTKTEALRQAKLKVMENKPNPFYWGAFVLTGSP
jgi:CHAT domain-containing protein/Flp pilus assembly protein TadD